MVKLYMNWFGQLYVITGKKVEYYCNWDKKWVTSRHSGKFVFLNKTDFTYLGSL